VAIAGVLAKVVLDDNAKENPAVLHYAITTGVNLASPRESDVSPVARWKSAPVVLSKRRAA
jgi:hypothetical protein